MTIKPGWEVSKDRIKWFEKILSTDQVGDPIITTKCVLGKENGFLIASNNGFAWRIKITYGRVMSNRIGPSPFTLGGKSKWIRWHDVASIIPKKPGLLFLIIKKRKNGALITDKQGNPKTTNKWKLYIKPNKGEVKNNFRQRQKDFYQIMNDLFNKNKGTTDPPMSDSRI